MKQASFFIHWKFANVVQFVKKSHNAPALQRHNSIHASHIVTRATTHPCTVCTRIISRTHVHVCMHVLNAHSITKNANRSKV